MNGASISRAISNFLVPHFSTRSSTASSSKLVPYFDMASLRVKTKESIRYESGLRKCDSSIYKNLWEPRVVCKIRAS